MKKQKILITGASGSIGRSLLKFLEGYELINLGRSKIEGIGNINCDFENGLDEVKLPNDIDAIIHLAQSPKFRDFPRSAKEMYQVNVNSTLFLADYASKNNVKKFIYASSGGIYGNRDSGFNETSQIPVTNLGFYLGSKLNSEIILDSYKDIYDVALLRFFFVYGENQPKSMLIPRLISNVNQGNEITINSSGGIKINPIYVEDAAKAIVKCLKLEGSNKFNIAGNEVLSIKELSEKIGNLLEVKPVFKIINNQSDNLIGSNDKMQEMLINPSIELNQGLKKLIKSYGL
jgi:nucleoside-diphosphate-sugar epimerase